MNYQVDVYSCGAAATSNALKSIGLNIDEIDIRKYSNTTEEGTSEEGIKNAIINLGLLFEEWYDDDKDLSLFWLRNQLTILGNPVILCVENWEHWVTAIGTIGQSIVVFDPSNFEHNKKENGVHVEKFGDIISIWSNDEKETEEKRFYALAVKNDSMYM